MKAYLSQKGISYTEKNIGTDPTALEALHSLRIMSVPVTQIGEAVIVGFAPDQIDAALT